MKDKKNSKVTDVLLCSMTLTSDKNHAIKRRKGPKNKVLFYKTVKGLST